MAEVNVDKTNASNAYYPEFGGSTGGWLQAAETEEKYVMTWTNSRNKTAVEENIFEMPTGGAAIMKQGPNIVYFARKEQCLALGSQLRTKFKINDYRVFRLLPSGEIQFIHPKDGVFPEKVNEGRVAVGKREFSIGKNPNPASIKFTGTDTFNT
jgi:photosystem I subunit 2